MKASSLVFSLPAAILVLSAVALGATACTANAGDESANSGDEALRAKCLNGYTYNARFRRCLYTPATTTTAPGATPTGPAGSAPHEGILGGGTTPTPGGPLGSPTTTPPPSPTGTTPRTNPTGTPPLNNPPPPVTTGPAGCFDLTFGVDDFGPFARDAILPTRGESDAEVNIFRSGFIQITLDYGSLRRYADPRYCSPYEFNCVPSFNRFRTLRVTAGLGAARVIRFALWSTPRNNVQYTQRSMIDLNRPYPNANDIPVGGTGPYTFEMNSVLNSTAIAQIAQDEAHNWMITAYVPDPSQSDIYRNRVCDLRFDVFGKSFGN